MTDKPILFNGPMVNAILEGRKTQTRRVLKPQPTFIESSGRWKWKLPPRAAKLMASSEYVYSASREFWEYAPENAMPYKVGDRLWVKEAHWAWGHWEKTQGLTKMGREKWRFVRDFDEDVLFDEPKKVAPDRSHLGWHKRNSLFMHKTDSRLTLVVDDVIVQRVTEISEADARAEGISKYDWEYEDGECCDTDKEAFSQLWNSINDAPRLEWNANPWVVAVTFETHKCNINQMEAAP